MVSRIKNKPNKIKLKKANKRTVIKKIIVVQPSAWDEFINENALFIVPLLFMVVMGGLAIGGPYICEFMTWAFGMRPCPQ
jgi:hypothetical protein